MVNSVEFYDPAAGELSSLPIAPTRGFAAAAPIPDGAGPDRRGQGLEPAGRRRDRRGLQSADEHIAAQSGPWALRAGIPCGGAASGRQGVGGGRGPFSFVTILASAKIFDPATDTFSSAGVGDMTGPVVASSLSDGRVLTRGWPDAGAVSDQERRGLQSRHRDVHGVGSMAVEALRRGDCGFARGRPFLVAGGLVS